MFVPPNYTVASYAAAAGAAKSDFLPKLYLKGSVGFAARDMDHFFKKKSFTYQIAPTLTWTLFQGMEKNTGFGIGQKLSWMPG